MGRSHYCNLSLPTRRCLPTTIKEARSGLALTRLLPDARKTPARAGPHVPYAGRQKNPGQGWPSRALCQAPEKALTRAISLAPMAAGFPVHLARPGLPRSKQSDHLCTQFSQGQTQELQGSLRTRLLWVDHRGGDKTKAEPQGQGN